MSFYIKRKEGIILTAIEIIDELGFQGLSTREIAKRQEIAEGTLYKHYRSKKEIILAVLDYYSMFDVDIKQTIEMNRFSAKDSITYFITRFAEYYESYPAMTSILQSYEVLKNEAGIAHRIIEIFELRSNLITYLIERGIKDGEIRPNVDSESLSDIILGTFRAITLKWRIRKYSFPLKERILTAQNYIMETC
ncbi:TetR/AcrR family transcriptional regulator [Petroclostridium sp. X23]|uniref:TetR/AcrR family transcriptional regulator n=1 Tax=Petroclostridium sp. X23 TaxID=3045146 RepID=UPI0024ACDE7D|nr:TetR/AcrR family transcriptional regulator [Petroclostridium sp. X23]WHH61379.1 TetR/AcrR family transcriptional regulator [Petroclostridium sp. X23]